MKTLIAVLLCSLSAFGQSVRFDSMALGPKGPLPNVTITVCTGTATGTPCSPQATTFSDITIGTPCSPGFQVTLPGSNLCQATSDALGNYGFWLAPGTYIYSVTGANITGKNYTLTVPVGADANGNVAITGGLAVGGAFTAGSYTNNLSVFAATTSAQLAGVISDETGTGPLVFANGGTIAPTSVTSGQIIQPAATIATWKDNNGGTRVSIPSNGTSQGTLNNFNLTGGSTVTSATLTTPILGTTTISEAPRMVLISGFQSGNLAAANVGSAATSKGVTVEAIAVHSTASAVCTVNPSIRVRNAGATVTTPTLTLTTGTSDWTTTGNAVNYAGSDLLFIEVTSTGTCTTPPANIMVNVTGRMQ